LGIGYLFWFGCTKELEVDMSTTNVTWDQIRKQFTEKDIDHMKKLTGGDMDLGDCKSVHDWAQQIYEQVSAGTMPPGDPWSPEWINNFKAWMDAGAQCPNK
jgi:hypothetical protein